MRKDNGLKHGAFIQLLPMFSNSQYSVLINLKPRKLL